MAMRDEDFGATPTLTEADEWVLVAADGGAGIGAARLAVSVRTGAGPRGDGAGCGRTRRRHAAKSCGGQSGKPVPVRVR